MFRASTTHHTQRWTSPFAHETTVVASFNPLAPKSAVTVITTRIRVAADGAVSLADPLTEGEHVARVTVAEPTAPRRSPLDLPVHRGLWDDSLSLHREDLYDDHGR